MKKSDIFVLLLFLQSFCSLAQPVQLPANVLEQLEVAEKDMVNALTHGDTSAFRSIAGDDYFDINANGTVLTLAGMLKDVPNFKGSSISLSEQSQRVYGNFVLRNGRARFYAGDKQVGEVFYTQGWVFRNKKWQFVHWQGTATKESLQKQ